MSKRKSKEHIVAEKTEQHISIIRWLLLFSTAGFDAALKKDFDFPPIIYIVVVCVILGLDISKLIKFFRK